jgi:hypothetical protein
MHDQIVGVAEVTVDKDAVCSQRVGRLTSLPRHLYSGDAFIHMEFRTVWKRSKDHNEIRAHYVCLNLSFGTRFGCTDRNVESFRTIDR